MAMRVFPVSPRLTAALRATRPLSIARRPTYPLVPGKAGSPHCSPSEAGTDRRTCAQTPPSSSSFVATSCAASKGENPPAHRIAPELHRPNFLGFWALGPAPFDARTLEKWPCESKSEFHGFLINRHLGRVVSRRAERRFLFISFGINPFCRGRKNHAGC